MLLHQTSIQFRWQDVFRSRLHIKLALCQLRCFKISLNKMPSTEEQLNWSFLSIWLIGNVAWINWSYDCANDVTLQHTPARCDITQQEPTRMGDASQHNCRSQPKMDGEEDERNENRMEEKKSNNIIFLVLLKKLKQSNYR